MRISRSKAKRTLRVRVWRWLSNLVGLVRPKIRKADYPLPVCTSVGFHVRSDLATLPAMPSFVLDAINEGRRALQSGRVLTDFAGIGESCGFISARITNAYGDAFVVALHTDLLGDTPSKTVSERGL